MENQTEVETKIEGKFYPLQHDEWIRACQQLSSSARDVLYYIRTADPEGNGVEIIVADLATDLGVHRSTVSRALKELDAKDYIKLEITKSRARLSARARLSPELAQEEW